MRLIPINAKDEGGAKVINSLLKVGMRLPTVLKGGVGLMSHKWVP